jgi:hypothetical protein
MPITHPDLKMIMLYTAKGNCPRREIKEESRQLLT